MQFESDPEYRLYVGNLSFKITEEDVRSMFSTTGKVIDVYLPRIYKTTKHKGFGFVEMESYKDAKNSIAQLHERPDLFGRNMVVRFADVRRSVEEQAERRKKAFKSNRDNE